MNYQDYLAKEKEKQKDKQRFGAALAPLSAHPKRTRGFSYRMEYAVKGQEDRMIEAAKHTSGKTTHFCAKCPKTVSLYARRKQQDKFKHGKGYSGLLCNFCLRFEQ